jgi:ABC-2 type transport system ATP-binding protein
MIDAHGLARTFKTKHGVVEAVAGVDLQVEAGEIVGFLGPNGAGKTTTLRMLTTLIDPTAGQATVAGCDLRTDPVGSGGASATSGGTGSSPSSSWRGWRRGRAARCPVGSGAVSTSPWD